MKNSAYNRLSKKASCWKNIVVKDIFLDYNEAFDLVDALEKIKKNEPILKKLLAFLELDESRLNHWYHKKYPFARRWEVDKRDGDETYGWESDEAVKYNLNYISDRSMCCFRVRWMLWLIKQDRFNHLQTIKYNKK